LLNRDAAHLCASLRTELQNVKSLGNVERAGRTIRLPTLVVEDTVRDIRILLHFAQQHARTDGVRASRRNKEGVSGLHRTPRQATLHIGIGKRLAKNFRRDTGFHAQQEFGAWPGGDCVPHLRFAHTSGCSFVAAGIFIVGVNLHGELVFREDELQKQRNARGSLQPAPFPFG
jgi:hypothetical protein